jgi:hypothetical protein
MVFEGIVGLGVAMLLAPAIAEYAKLRHKAEKGFSWVATAGVFLIFSAAFTVLPSISSPTGWLSVVQPVGAIFEVVGWLFALIGVLFIAYEVLLEK